MLSYVSKRKIYLKALQLIKLNKTIYNIILTYPIAGMVKGGD